jgi:hypothetical protein
VRVLAGRFIVPAVLAFVSLTAQVLPALAQAPVPKVTISGLFDQITSMGRNTYDGNLTRNSDAEWYARTRFRPDFEFAVGRVKAVLGLEIDLMYGQGGPNDGGFPGNNTGFVCGTPQAQSAGPGQQGRVPPSGKVNTNGCLDLNTDVGGMIEIKWIYTEFPLTGKDSLLPFIPIETMARAGGQPFDTLAGYKLAQYANGDFAGISAITTIMPNLKANLAWVIVEDQLAGANRGNPSLKTGRGEDYALIASLDISPTKGLDLKPLYSWFHADGQTSGFARRELINRGSAGGALNFPPPFVTTAHGAPGVQPAAGSPNYHEDRHTIGFDARWRLGSFSLDPTFYYQWGRVDSQAIDNGPGANGVGTKKVTGDMSALHFDLLASYQLGSVLIEGRGVYSTGNKARDNLAKGIRYYQPLDTDGNYWAGGWTQFWATGIDYFNQGWAATGNYVGYDRYGRAGVAGRISYFLTPALSLYGVVHALFTSQPVDTDTGSQLAAAGGTGVPARTTASQNSWVAGDSNYLGTELNLGLTWNFSENTAFDLVGGYLFSGSALDASECRTFVTGATPNAACSNGTVVKMDSKDAYTVAARVRFAF